jgi:hypothetical protein
MRVRKLQIKLFVIPRLDPPIKSEDGIQKDKGLDCPVKPDNDRLYEQKGRLNERCWFFSFCV